MPSFDIVSKIDIQSLDNAINTAIKEVQTRYDLQGTGSTIELDKKSLVVHVLTPNDMLMERIEDVIRSRMIKQRIDPRCMDFGKELYASGDKVKKDIKIKQGIDRETAKKIVSDIKNTKLKVQPQIMDEQVRVTAKKIDDLQTIIAFCKSKDYGIPLQYDNMK